MFHSCSILGIGTDIVDVLRIENSFKQYQDAFLKRVYTDEEISYCFKQKNPFPSLAARFCAKEAVSKALGVGIGASFNWRSSSIAHCADKKPLVILDPLGEKLLHRMGGKQILISISHTRTLAQAFAIVVC